MVDCRNPSVQGSLLSVPYGIILHGSRASWPDREQEWDAMLRFARAGAGGLCWHVTVYDDRLAIHAEPDEWGWHARSYSRTWLGIEFVQPGESDDITDGQVMAAAWWMRERVLARWPDMELELRAHSEIKPGIDDGKTDVFRPTDSRLPDLKQRIIAAI